MQREQFFKTHLKLSLLYFSQIEHYWLQHNSDGLRSMQGINLASRQYVRNLIFAYEQAKQLRNLKICVWPAAAPFRKSAHFLSKIFYKFHNLVRQLSALGMSSGEIL